MTHDRDRHPRFDEFWEQHKALVFFMARKMSQRFHCDKEELVGSLTLWFNRVLYTFEENKGKFSTYFCRRCQQYLLHYWMRRESQSWDLFVSKMDSTTKDRELSERNYAQHEVDFHLYRIPETDESDVHEVINFFDTMDECWHFMLRGLDNTNREMMELYYRSGWTGQQISEKFQVSKQRVFQRLDRARLHIREKIRNVSAFAHLFSEDDKSAGDGEV